MSKFADKKFWVGTFDRAIASFAQGVIATSGLDGIGILDIDWTQVLSLSGSYALLSLLTSVVYRGNEAGITATEREADYQAELSRAEIRDQ